MELDEQLAALAAGELDDADARALQARVAGDPALARRLARLRRLDELLVAWDVPEMSDGAAQRLDDAVAEALAELDDAPLVERTVTALPQPLAEGRERDEPAASSPRPRRDDGVVDLAAERERRGLPAWVPAATVAAVLVGVVGIGIGLSGLTGDRSSLDVATQDSDDSAEEFGPESNEIRDTTGDAADDGAEPPPEQLESAPSTTYADDSAAAEDAAGAGPALRTVTGVELDEGELQVLAALARGEVEDQAGDVQDGATTSPPAEACVDEALLRDTPQGPDRVVELVASGSYADQEAVFVVVRAPGETDDLLTLLAYDPADCSLLAGEETGA